MLKREFKKAKKAQIVGVLDGSENKMFFVGWLGKLIAVIVASDPEDLPSELTAQTVKTIDQMLTFNPEGWELKEDLIADLESKAP